MLELLRDPIWQFIGAIVALVTVLISVAIYIAQRRRKDLSFEILANVPLLTVEEDSVGELQLLFREVPVKRTRLFLARIVNTGNVPVTGEDYDAPITLRFSDRVQVLSAVITEQSPRNLSVSAQTATTQVSFSKTLLNPGDSFSCRVLVSNYSKGFAIESRVAGVSEVRPLRFGGWTSPALALLGIIIMIAGVILSPSPSPHVGEVRSHEVPYYPVIIALLGFAIMNLGTVLLARDIFRDMRHQKIAKDLRWRDVFKLRPLKRRRVRRRPGV
jgi:hypothetical protein